MNAATPILDAYIPTVDESFNGVRWLRFSMDTESYYEYQEWPNALVYDGKTFAKTSWNSDNHSITYKETRKIAIPV